MRIHWTRLPIYAAASFVIVTGGVGVCVAQPVVPPGTTAPGTFDAQDPTGSVAAPPVNPGTAPVTPGGAARNPANPGTTVPPNDLTSPRPVNPMPTPYANPMPTPGIGEPVPGAGEGALTHPVPAPGAAE